MKRYLLLFIYTFSGLAVCAQSPVPHTNKVTIAFYGDYLQEDLRWSIAGNSSGQNPNVLSELIWKDLKLRGAGVDIKVNIFQGIFFTGNYHRAKVYAGTATDTDYGADNRTSPTFMANLTSDQGHMYSYLTGLGYQLRLSSIFSLSPYLGYSKSSQFLHLTDSGAELTNGEKQLNSTYQTTWSGPLLGLTGNAGLTDRIALTAGFNYMNSKYKGVADWNLIDSFVHPVSFMHRANGYQANIDLQLSYKVIPQLSVIIQGKYRTAETGKGTDQLFLNDGRTLNSQFNGAINTGKEVSIGIVYHPVF
jgi:hypothetical protein